MKYLRFPALALAGAMTFSLLSACGGKDTSETATVPPSVSQETTTVSNSNSPAVSESPAETVTPTATETATVSSSPAASETLAGTASAVPTVSAAPAVSVQPSASAAISAPPSKTPAASAKPSVKPSAAPTPTPTPTPEPTPAETPAPSVDDVWAAVSGSVDQTSLMDLDDSLLASFYGIDAADLDGYVAKTPAAGTSVHEVFLAKVKSGKMDAIQKGVSQRQSDLEDSYRDYLPDQLELVKNYKMETSGDYILFLIGENAADAVNAFHSIVG